MGKIAHSSRHSRQRPAVGVNCSCQGAEKTPVKKRNILHHSQVF
jgi:hypothetical protein